VDGTYFIEGYESLGAGPKALKILKSVNASTGAKTWYYVESRKAVGFDSFLALEPTQNILDGLLIRLGTEGNGDSSHLLDMTPATPVYYWWYDPALAEGQSFTDPSNGLTITASSVNGSAAAVTVQFGLAITVSTDKTSYTRTETITVSAMVSSNGVKVTNTAVNFAVQKSNGSVVTGSATTNNKGIATYKLKLTKKDPVGTYQATASASLATATTNFTVR
jgi:hypothetical protein